MCRTLIASITGKSARLYALMSSVEGLSFIDRSDIDLSRIGIEYKKVPL